MKSRNVKSASFQVASSLITGAILAFGLLSAPLAKAQSGPIDMSDSKAPSAPATTAPKKGSVVGRRAAEKYMETHTPTEENRNDVRTDVLGRPTTTSDHYLAVHLGMYVSDNAYRWGNPDSQADVGDATVGVTYRIGEWQNSMDLALRIDYSAYGLRDGTASQLSFSPMVTFPDASSRFPLYLGAGIGAGIFTKQISGESAIAFDYQLVLGARFFEVFANTGFFVEAGIKNHILVLSDGQFNGTFVALGPVFTF